MILVISPKINLKVEEKRKEQRFPAGLIHLKGI
jgi:hypothetical protein